MNRDALEQSIEGNEGFREAPYKDTEGLWTFAIGRCLEKNPLTAEEWRFLLGGKHLQVSISYVGAKWLMNRSLDAELSKLRGLHYFDKLAGVAQEVLVEMCYQMGITGVLGFHKMLAALSRHDYKEAAKHGRDSLWWREQTRARAEALMQRLEAIPSAT